METKETTHQERLVASWVNDYKVSKAALARLRETALTYCQDGVFDLKTNWEIFTTLELGEDRGFIVHLPEPFERLINDGGLLNRNEEVDLVNRIEWLEADLREDWADPEVTQEALDTLKKFCIDNNVRSYKFDW